MGCFDDTKYQTAAARALQFIKNQLDINHFDYDVIWGDEYGDSGMTGNVDRSLELTIIAPDTPWERMGSGFSKSAATPKPSGLTSKRMLIALRKWSGLTT